MKVHVDLQHATQDVCGLPSPSELECWVAQALTAANVDQPNVEITVRVVEPEESQHLNHTYRGQDKPTNVLAFPFTSPQEVNLPLLGDLVICAEIVRTQADEQGKTLQAHWAHLIVHGTLHLLGYDHISDTQAEEMESLECKILTDLGYPDPYQA